MSLYNMLHGQNPFAPVLLGWLNLTTGDVGRFRDVFIDGTPEDPHIVVFTRNGGGNREAYEHVTDALRAHPLFVRDWDDDFDCTYASYEFRAPEVWRSAAAAMLGELAPMERMAALLEKLQSAPKDDPEVVRVVEKVQPLMEAIQQALGSPRSE